MQTTATVIIDAPLDEVWAEAVDFGAHHEWMGDAVGITFETDQRTGPGTTLLIETRVGPLRTMDRFEVTEIEMPHIVRGTHHGAVSGRAEWRLSETPDGIRFEWFENLTFPWFFGGRIGEFVAKPILTAIWKKNLVRLKDRVEGSR